jgi:hypothetical protein
VNGQEAGATLTVRGPSAKLRVRARARSIESYEVLEIVVNGKVVRTVRPRGAQHEAAIDDVIQVDRGGWIAARAHGRKMLPYGATWWHMPVFAHSSPVYLDMHGRTADAHASAELLLDQLSYLRRWAEKQANFPTPENRAEALRWIDEAEAKYRKLL